MNKLAEEKQIVMNQVLSQPLIARLATADLNNQPHVVPVWFGWDGEYLWISSFSNTRKVKDLQQNPKVSVAIDVSGDDGKTQAVIMEGQAELVVEPRGFLRKQFQWIYTLYLGEEGVKAKDPQEWIEDSHNLLIKLSPEQVYVWNW
jgi:nitroimidazol reductase NimA-like FMN-containing flavoprotein (pyridoxamine 5'-phosphate oxidase superfamily)